MIKTFVLKALVGLTMLLATGSTARAEMVTYLANLSTSKGNPVTDVLILETDGIHPVHASVYPHDLPGNGTVLVRHDAPFAPTQSLLIGLTEGMDDDGSDKTQIVMFLEDDFAAANAGVPYSSVFPGARHSETIARLLAAVAGDTTELAWFTDTFFYGPAAGAAFRTGGSFTVAEFTGLDTIGNSATFGNWMITAFDSLDANDPNAQSGRVTALIEEIAKVDKGPFDIVLTPDDNGTFAIDKTVMNDTGMAWTGFVMELGTGSGAGFVPSGNANQLGFVQALNNREETGAFPGVQVQGSRIVFSGALPPGGTANFIAFAQTATNATHTITLRQRALCPEPVPAMETWALSILVLMLGASAACRLRRAELADRAA
jgi:hypothetical protein